MKILFIGDIIGKPGRDILVKKLPGLRRERAIDAVVANAENAAGGSGITVSIFQTLIEAEVDVLTLGDHAFKQKEIMPLLDRDDRIVRPANFPEKASGRGWTVFETSGGEKLCVISLMGRTFMRPVDCPFVAVERVLRHLTEAEPELKTIMIDMHAEATSDKQLMGRFLDGRVSAVLGTHTHVATADEQILPGGTAFQCDVGMCGPFESIIGRRIDRVLETVVTFRPTVYDVARGDTRINGTLVDIDTATGKARGIERVVVPE